MKRLPRRQHFCFTTTLNFRIGYGHVIDSSRRMVGENPVPQYAFQVIGDSYVG